jgi:MFS family permease
VLDAITSYFVALIVYSKLPETRPDKQQGIPAENFAQTLAGYKVVLQDRTFMIFILFSILITTAYLQVFTTLSLFLVNFLQMPESFYGALLVLNAVMVVVFQIPITRWAAKRSLLGMMIGGTALFLAGFGSYGLAPSVPLFVIATALITIGEMLVVPTSQALTALLAPEDLRGRYAAIGYFNWIIAQSLGPVAGAAIMDRFDPRWVWYGSSILCAISMGGFYGLHRRSGGRLSAKQDEAVGTRDKATRLPAAAQSVSPENT